MQLAGQTIAVTGASGFIGQALCQRLATEGATAVGIDRRREETGAVASTDGRFICADVLDRDAMSAALEGCDWIHHYKQMNPTRRLVYRCVETLLNLEDTEPYLHALRLMFGAQTLSQAQALISGEERFFGLDVLGVDMQGSPMHTTLLAAYDKLFAPSA